MITRLSNVATHFGSSSLKLNFLDDDESWRLFVGHTCREEVCPPELESIGKNIVKKCKGLPLSIIVMGGLARSSKTRKHWESIAEDMNSILNSNDGNDHSILSLSYAHLSTHLKPCFLFLGVFPEDHEIRVSQLVKLWIAEGFLKSNSDKSLEHVAESYLKDLVDRNVVLVRRWGRSGKIKTCYIHDLFRDLCLKIALEEEFFCVAKEFDGSQVVRVRRVLSHGISWQSSLTINSGKLQLYRGGLREPSHNGLEFHVVSSDKIPLHLAISRRVNLRFLTCFSINPFEFFSPASLSWNMQTLICYTKTAVFAPTEIWMMKQLRHIEFSDVFLPDPPVDRVNECDEFVLQHLHTLMKVVNFGRSQEVFERIPGIKRLKLDYRHHPFSPIGVAELFLSNLYQLRKLESLHINLRVSDKWGTLILKRIRFPLSLKKLTVAELEFGWDDMITFGLLPHLEVLVIKNNQKGVQGHEWKPVEGEFCSLKSLKVDNCGDLIHWNAESSHFPMLECLHFGYVPNLEEIPLSIGDTPTLQSISLQWCKASAAISAMKILNEQESFGNESLQVQIRFKSRSEIDNFNKQVELEGLTSKNFHVDMTIETLLPNFVAAFAVSPRLQVALSRNIAVAAATRLQVAFREYLLKKRSKEVTRSYVEMSARRVAAVKIQRAFWSSGRGRRLTAALKIQRAYRYFECRKRQKVSSRIMEAKTSVKL